MGTCCEHVCEVFCARLKCNKLYGECPLQYLSLPSAPRAALSQERSQIAEADFRSTGFAFEKRRRLPSHVSGPLPSHTIQTVTRPPRIRVRDTGSRESKEQN